MKSLVVYSSQTGNTRKLAEVVYDTLSGEKEVYPTADAPDPENYDFIAVGFWLMAGRPDANTLEYLPKIKDKPLFLFVTHGAAAGSNHANEAMDIAKSLVPEADIRGAFSCQGEVNPKVLEKMKAKPAPPVWLENAPAAAGHPNDTDIEKLKRLVSTL